jgi:hypothetical protein
MASYGYRMETGKFFGLFACPKSIDHYEKQQNR